MRLHILVLSYTNAHTGHAACNQRLGQSAGCYAAENLQFLALWCTTLDETVSLLRTRSEKEGDVERVVKDSDVC